MIFFKAVIVLNYILVRNFPKEIILLNRKTLINNNFNSYIPLSQYIFCFIYFTRKPFSNKFYQFIAIFQKDALFYVWWSLWNYERSLVWFWCLFWYIVTISIHSILGLLRGYLGLRMGFGILFLFLFEVCICVDTSRNWCCLGSWLFGLFFLEAWFYSR